MKMGSDWPLMAIKHHARIVAALFLTIPITYFVREARIAEQVRSHFICFSFLSIGDPPMHLECSLSALASGC
jgi:hypothetical protein